MKTFKIVIPLQPTSASRVRVTKFGSFYLKKYNDFRTEAKKFLIKFKKEMSPTDNKFKIEIEFICKKPKTSTYDYPAAVGDIDNLTKAVLDAITSSGIIWLDDRQVVELIAIKRYQEVGEDSCIKLKVTELK
jgi:Holliday junction resolvase RusA-like endonuclease